MNTTIKKIEALFYAGIGRLRNKSITDEYITWLTFANAGMLDKGNTYCMDYAIKNLPSDSPVVEIGSFCGLSTNVMNYLLSTHGKKNKIFTCDRWIFETAENEKSLGNSDIKHKDYREFAKSSFIRNVQFFSAKNIPHTIELFSDEFFELWKNNSLTKDVFGCTVQLGGKISFCYIDGNHTYEYARRDFVHVDAYLEKGGYILFDDSSDLDVFGLKRLMKEVKKNNKYELVMKNPNYLFRKIS